MNLREAAQQALEALKELQGGCTDSDDGTVEAITVWCPKVIENLAAALEQPEPFQPDWDRIEPLQEALREHMAEIRRLRAALEQPEQEPVAWMVYTEDGKSAYVTDNPHDLVGAYKAFALYTHPPRREWRGLTDEDIEDACPVEVNRNEINFARAIEAALKEKNHE